MIDFFIIINSINWCCAYTLIDELKPSKDLRLVRRNSRIFSSIHAIVVFILCAFYLVTDKYNIVNFNAPNSFATIFQIKNFILTLPIGYAIADLGTMILNKEVYNFSAKFTIPHHLLLIFMIRHYINIYPQLIAMGLLSEITNPFINYGQDLIEDLKINTSMLPQSSPIPPSSSQSIMKKLKFISYILIPLFFMFRILNFGALTYLIRNEKGVYAVLLLLVMNIYWFYKLLRKITLVKSKFN
jgi:hypothetical protein